jgi:glutathione synthase/RimK-type ligase-like ATP-grasp enzyme
LDAELRELAEAACRAVAVDYGGVDIMRGRDGLAQVVEVNGIPAWRGLQSVCGFDIAQRLVDDLLTRKLPAPALSNVA